MYGLFPIAYPIAKLLNRLLGASHGLVFNRAALKKLIILHEHLIASKTERISREETMFISSMLDLKDTPVSSIMTPLSKVFTLSFDTYLNDMTRYKILGSGYKTIPIHISNQPSKFMGALQTKSLFALNFEEITMGQLALDDIPMVSPTASSQELFSVFRNNLEVHMALVTKGGVIDGQSLGIVTVGDITKRLVGMAFYP